MSTTTESLFQALLNLSGNPALAHARNNVFSGISMEDLQTLVNYSMGDSRLRRDPKRILAAVFDIIADEKTTARESDADEEAFTFKREDGGGRMQQVEAQEQSRGRSAFSSRRTASGPSVQGPGAELQRDHRRGKRQRTGITGDAILQPVFGCDDQSVGSETTTISQRPASSSRHHDPTTGFPLGLFHKTPAKASAQDKRDKNDQKQPEFILWVPGEDGNGMWGPDASPAIRSRFQTNYRSSENHRSIFARFLKDEEKHLKEKICVNFKVYYGGSSTDQCEWTQAKGNERETCDKCIRLGRLCARLAKIDGVVKLAIYPLPSRFRIARRPDEIEFWCVGRA